MPRTTKPGANKTSEESAARRRKPAEAAREARARQSCEPRVPEAVAYEQFAELTSDGIWRFDVVPSVSTRLPAREQAEGILAGARLGFCNSALARLYGLERPEDMVGRTLRSWLAGSDEEKVRLIADSVGAGYRLSGMEARTQNLQGGTVWTLNNVAGIVKRGRVVGGWGVTHDITDRKAAETALREALAHLRATLAAFPDLVFELDAEGRFHEYLAPDPAQLYVPAEAFLGKSIREVIPAEPARILLDALDEAVRTGSHRGAKYALEMPAGRRWFELSIAAKGDGRGARARYIAIARDITAQEAASAALRVGEERLNLALTAASDGVYDIDLRTGESHYSPGYYTMLGFRPDEFAPSQEAWEGLLHPDDKARALDMLARCVNGSTDEAETEFRLRTKAGEWRRIVSRGRIVSRDETGRALRLVGTHRDVTAQWEAAEAVRQERDRAQAYLDIAGVMLVALDRKGAITLINAKGCRLLGYEQPSELIGKDWFMTCLPETAVAATRDVFRRMMAGELEAVEYYENPILAKSGELIEMAWHNALVRDSAGTIIGALSSGEDITERKRAERALERTVSLLSHSEEISHVGSWELNYTADRIMWSDELYRIFGLEPQEFPPTNEAFYAILHPEDRNAVRDAYRDALRERKESYESWHRLVRARTGEVRYVHEKCTIARDPAGTPVRISGIVQDVTELRRVESAIRESEERFRRIFEQSPMGMVTVDGSFRFTKANEAFCRMVGYSEGELLALRFVDITHPDHVRDDVESVKRVARGEIPSYRTEKRYVRKDGRTVWGALTASAMRDAQGHLLYFLSMIEDITATKESQAALAESERKYRELANDLPTCVFEADLHGHITYANRTGLQWFGYRMEEIGRMDIAEMVAADERERAMRTFRDAVEKGEIPAGEYTAVRQDKSTFPALVSSRAIVRDGKAVGVRGILIDVSERVEAARRVERALAGTIHALAVTTEMRDPYTAGHQERVTALALAIGKKMGLPETRLEGLRVAGLLHDVGKVSVPAEILSKPTGLSEIELALVRSHPETGHAILREIDFPWPVASIVLQHHERMDGSGYPNGLRGEEILLEARILAVADSVEAMASHRPYRAALGITEALAELERGTGTAFDPDAASACQSLFSEDGFRWDG